MINSYSNFCLQEFCNKKNSTNNKKPKQEIKLVQLCNGPGKLCVGFNIDKSVNEQDLSTWNKMWFEYSDDKCDIDSSLIVKSKRIGIDSVGEPWSSKPLRFYIYNSLFVSKRDKKNEEIVKLNLESIS